MTFAASSGEVVNLIVIRGYNGNKLESLKMLLGVELATVQTPYDRLTKDSKLGLNIKLRREELNLTQVQLADRLGQTKHWVSERECGYVELKWQELDAIASALQCSSDELKPR